MLLRALLVFFLTLFVFECTAIANDRVDIIPRRVILQPRERSGEFTLLNLSNSPSTYRVEIVNYRQDEKGVYSNLDKPLNPAFDPEKVLRLSPRQFTLAPEGRQKVRFSIRKPENLPDGEYRFHIRAMRMTEYGPPAPVGKGSSVGMTMNIGAAIPVVIRHGRVESAASLNDLKYVAANAEGTPELQFTINRTGNASLIGVAKAIWQPAGGQPQEIGVLSNLNVFTENDRRLVAMPLKAPISGGGTVQLIYINDENKTVYAETTLQL